MHEEIPKTLTPEQIAAEKQKKEDDAWLAQYMESHPDIAIAPEDRRECGPEVVEFEKMIDRFESEHPLAELNSIIDLTVADAPLHPVREPASRALIPIQVKMHVLRDETDISAEKYAELKLRWKKISNAVGIIRNNRVDHDR